MHYLIPERSFEFSDLFGNLIGVIIVLIIFNLDKINENYKVDLFKDYYLNDNLLSNLKTTNKILNVLAGVYAKENNLNNCVLLNNKKNVVEFLN